MKLDSRKRMASDVMGIGKKRIWLDPEEVEEIDNAITKEDIRALIKQGIISEIPKTSISRGRIRKKMEKKKRGQRKRKGSRKGTANARYPAKKRHMDRIRSLRRKLSDLKENKKIDVTTYRKLYNLSGGGYFRDLDHLNAYMKDKEFIK